MDLDFNLFQLSVSLRLYVCCELVTNCDMFYQYSFSLPHAHSFSPMWWSPGMHMYEASGESTGIATVL